MKIGVLKETTEGETRVALTPEGAKKAKKLGLDVVVEFSAGEPAHFSNEDYEQNGAALSDKQIVLKSDILFKVNPPSEQEVAAMKQGAVLISCLNPFQSKTLLDRLAQASISALAMELIPRTSRAQSMDVLSSQANIAGYRAVLKAASHFGRFFSLMMTSAGMSKPAKVIVLGAGVAGLQAIATARRLGAVVEAFDVRQEVKEQIESLGAKFIDLQLGEAQSRTEQSRTEGSSQDGYAKALSEEAQKKQQEALTQKLKSADIVISTANVPGRKAPMLITEEAVRGMKKGSVIVDMAAANGGNCPLTEPNKVIQKNGVTLIGYTNLPALQPTDASQFYGNNCIQLLGLLLHKENNEIKLKFNLEDDIVAAALVTHEGKMRWKG